MKKMRLERFRELLKVTASKWQNWDFIYFTNIIEHLLYASAPGRGKWIRHNSGSWTVHGRVPESEMQIINYNLVWSERQCVLRECPEVMGAPRYLHRKWFRRRAPYRGSGNGVQPEIGLQQVDLKLGGRGVDTQEQARGEVLGRWKNWRGSQGMLKSMDLCLVHTPVKPQADFT